MQVLPSLHLAEGTSPLAERTFSDNRTVSSLAESMVSVVDSWTLESELCNPRLRNTMAERYILNSHVHLPTLHSAMPDPRFLTSGRYTSGLRSLQSRTPDSELMKL